MNTELAIHNLTEQVRLLTERLDKMENRFVKTTYELYSVTDIKNGDVHTMCTSVPGGLNDAEPKEVAK